METRSLTKHSRFWHMLPPCPLAKTARKRASSPHFTCTLTQKHCTVPFDHSTCPPLRLPTPPTPSILHGVRLPHRQSPLQPRPPSLQLISKLYHSLPSIFHLWHEGAGAAPTTQHGVPIPDRGTTAPRAMRATQQATPEIEQLETVGRVL
ncbi:hypothetical protein TRVL_09653 [Trypanosoma vivax]|nr:hypothetical protein TRVL_09653 [Trypanosoma vivax]